MLPNLPAKNCRIPLRTIYIITRAEVTLRHDGNYDEGKNEDGTRFANRFSHLNPAHFRTRSRQRAERMRAISNVQGTIEKLQICK